MSISPDRAAELARQGMAEMARLNREKIEAGWSKAIQRAGVAVQPNASENPQSAETNGAQDAWSRAIATYKPPGGIA